MRRRSIKRSHTFGGGDPHGDGLMITPLLDLFVSLIPFLVLGAVMTKINIVDVGISKPVQTVKANNSTNFDLQVKIYQSKADVLVSGKAVFTTPLDEQGQWMGQVRKKLVEIKKNNLDEHKIKIEPVGSVKLETVMAFMDEARNLKPEDGEITKKENGKLIKLKYLFPNVILRGVYDT